MEMSKIIKMVEKDFISTAKNIIRSGQQHAPMFIIYHDGIFDVMLAEFQNDMQKEAVAITIESFCRKKRADFCVFITEAWYVARKNIPENIRASEESDRKECLHVAILKPNGENTGFMIPIDRVNGEVEFGKVQKHSQALAGRFVFTW